MSKYRYGLSEHPLYTSLYNAHRRCTNPKNKAYRWYKGRWKFEDFDENFEDAFDYCLPLWEKSEEHFRGVPLSIDRIDNSKGYEEGNIQFIPRSENSRKGTKNNCKPISLTGHDTGLVKKEYLFA